MGFALAIGASNGPPRLGGASPYHGFLNHQSSLFNPSHIGETPVEPRSCGRPMGFAFAIGRRTDRRGSAEPRPTMAF